MYVCVFHANCRQYRNAKSKYVLPAKDKNIRTPMSFGLDFKTSSANDVDLRPTHRMQSVHTDAFQTSKEIGQLFRFFQYCCTTISRLGRLKSTLGWPSSCRGWGDCIELRFHRNSILCASTKRDAGCNARFMLSFCVFHHLGHGQRCAVEHLLESAWDQLDASAHVALVDVAQWSTAFQSQA